MVTKTTFKFIKLAGVAVLCLVSLNPANADSQAQRKAKKPAPPPLHSGPTGPVPQIPLDSIAPVAPQVSYQNGQLTIVAPNSTLADILRAVRKQTGAEIEIPEARERVVTHIGPGPARAVIAELLNGSRFNYVLLGSSQDADALTRVVLVAKSAQDTAGVNNAMNQAPPQPTQPVMSQVMSTPPTQEQIDDGEADDNTPTEDSDQSAAEDQPQPPPDQPEVKTPQQMLQEMQQRQLQMQQQQQAPGQPPIPVPGVPYRPPQQPQQQ